MGWPKGKKQTAEHIAKVRKTIAKLGYTGFGHRVNTPEILWSKVDKRGPDECWPWKQKPHIGGYCITEIGGKAYYAHRVIFDLANPGVISLSAPKDNSQSVMHTCDNPVCCNPAHLKVGTHQENMADMMAKNRQTKYKSWESPAAKFSPDEIREIRLLKSGGATLEAIGLLFGAAKSTIGCIVYGISYQDVD